jgi:molybdopterin-guanine dinucleotide biosynthesis protein A
MATAGSGPDTSAAPAVAVILAGGGSRRWGGVDKTAARLAGLPVLAHVIGGLPPGMPAIVVAGVDHPVARLTDPARVRWTREEPPGGGPVAGLAAAAALLPEGTAAVVLLAGDLPFAGSAVPRLLDRLSGSDVQAVLGIDAQGRPQPLLAAYRAQALSAALTADGAPPAGRSLQGVLRGLRRVLLPVTAEEAFDLDTPADLAAAHECLRTAAIRRDAPGGGPDARTDRS